MLFCTEMYAAFQPINNDLFVNVAACNWKSSIYNLCIPICVDLRKLDVLVHFMMLNV